jgi:hypothetical protein
MSFAISSVSQTQNIPAESPPQAAIRRENDTKWCDAFTQQNLASSQQAGMGSHPTVAETSKSLGFQVEAGRPKVLTASTAA